MVTSYEFNGKQPRFFSKFFNAMDPLYDVTLATAVGGSSSAPLYFDPKEYINEYNITNELIDGGIICNNPSLYAYLMASELKEVPNHIEIVSLGTGTAEEKDEATDANSFNKAATATKIFDFMMQIESISADEILSALMGDSFVRMQVFTTADLATFGDKWYKIMREDGTRMCETPNGYEDNTRLKNSLTRLIEERYGPGG